MRGGTTSLASPATNASFSAGIGVRPSAATTRTEERCWFAKYRSFVYPSGRRFAVPFPIATCESGENYYVGPYGAYGLIFEAQWLPPKAQDEIAYRLYVAYGESPWAPYENSCAYR